MKSKESEIKICQTTLKVLRYSLIWPDEETQMNPGKWYYVKVATFFLVTSLWILSLIMHLTTTIINHLDVSLAEDISIILACFGNYYAAIICIKKQSQMAYLLRDLSRFEDFGKPPGFEEENKKLNFWSQICLCYTFFSPIIYNLNRVLEIPLCEKLNKEKGLYEICGLITPIWVPFRSDFFPVYHLLFLYLFIAAQLLAKLFLTISFKVFELAHHINLRINHLKIMILKCFDGKRYDVHQKNLRKCIRYHLHILNLSSRLDNCFSNIMFAHLTITATICGCLEKQFVDTNDFGHLLHIFGWIMTLFVACLGGQHLIDESSTIPETIFSSDWYKVDVRLIKDLVFMVKRSQENIHVSVGSFAILSFELFISVVKMSYSILTMLKS